MKPKIAVEPVDSIPNDARVRHYDELEYDAKGHFPSVVERGEQLIDWETAGQFSDGEFVKYTGYFRVLLA
ncbi:hypothetical protein ZOD2009_03345 [Haladaptatus paucihalophilus DX253]|uniref:DUF7979 domain-containing protein n=1 Tax=Haladaptatus paucihalophilus DX253 TaxID=797209 RepID=E7QNM9_HALPU|nr:MULTISPECIES: hypothetical protein [Haladaptatus]EFW94146.1 hypothetical protein ZOD2009_03345 [Haladaptatus paucihalophilus DX253]GKZ13004.1 hypothetical protein HAL_08850 [Haladaptatus sp. T7]SHK60330.1 hypothetical protein SAMN05444342_1823 [Haladaptatus paucihalophilus DX253]